MSTGFSFGEFLLICVVALVAVGPQKLPGVLRTLGQWTRKARNMLYDMRAQSGIDEILRAEGFHGGLNELRTLMRGQHGAVFPVPFEPPAAASATATSAAPQFTPSNDPYSTLDIDSSREYPPEGADARGALPDDLYDGASESESGARLAAASIEVPALENMQPAPAPAKSSEPS